MTVDRAAEGAPDLERLEASLGVTMHDRALLREAMSHRSWCAEHDEPRSNERLEFLGDAVLGLVVTDYVYDAYPDLSEGQLSEVRAGVVNARVLAETARERGVGEFLLLGKGEDAAGGRAKQSILADALEALFAAVYLDLGFERAREVILRCLRDRIAIAAEGPGDYKMRLQELAARRSLGRPEYVVRDEGPDHAKRFYASVLLAGEVLGEGEGRSKKQAEQAAAWVAYRRLGGEGEGIANAGAA